MYTAISCRIVHSAMELGSDFRIYTHPTMGYSPFSLMKACDVAFGHPTTATSAPNQVANLHKWLEAAYSRVREAMSTGNIIPSYSGKPFNDEDWVWLHSTVIPHGQAKKFHWPWTCPFQIV